MNYLPAQGVQEKLGAPRHTAFAQQVSRHKALVLPTNHGSTSHSSQKRVCSLATQGPWSARGINWLLHLWDTIIMPNLRSCCK
eukprot:5367015-Amphidinium_carterae.1